MQFIKIKIICLSILLFTIPAKSQTGNIIDPVRANTLLSELSGVIAKEHVINLSTFDRSGASKGYMDALLYVKKCAEEYGAETKIDRFPADGKTIYLNHRKARYAWEKKSAKLTMIEPFEEKIIDFAEIPTALIKRSNSADIITELVDVGSGLIDEDYIGKDVRGKIVLASGNSYAVFEKAIRERGAAGIITYWENHEPSRDRFPDQVAWVSIPQELNTEHFGFSVSIKIANRLKRLLRNHGTIKLHAQVDARNIVGEFAVLNAVIPGKIDPGKEVIFVSHLNHYKPGSNDNASGNGLNLEILRTYMTLIHSNKILSPAYTVRFLWLQEHTGSSIYVDRYRDIGDRGIIVINLDMVGEDVLQCESSFRITLTPDSCPGFANDLMEALANYVAARNITEYGGTKIPFTYVLEPYNGGISDHYWFVSQGIAIPSSFMYYWPDNYYHSNEDTPDRVDPTALRRVGMIAGGAGLIAAFPVESEITALVSEVTAKSASRLTQDVSRAVTDLITSDKQTVQEVYNSAANRMDWIIRRDAAAIETVSAVAPSAKARNAVKAHVSQYKILCDSEKARLAAFFEARCKELGTSSKAVSLSEQERFYNSLIPEKLFPGPLTVSYVADKLGKERYQWYVDAESNIPNFFVIKDEILNFIDGKRSVLKIANAVRAEYGEVSTDIVYTFIEGLTHADMIEFKK